MRALLLVICMCGCVRKRNSSIIGLGAATCLMEGQQLASVLLLLVAPTKVGSYKSDARARAPTSESEEASQASQTDAVSPASPARKASLKTSQYPSFRKP